MLTPFNNSASDNLVFMNNIGGEPGCTGVWTICGGNSQTYSDASVSQDASKCSVLFSLFFVQLR